MEVFLEKGLEMTRKTEQVTW